MRSAPSLRGLLRSEGFWLVLGALVALCWFQANLHLPPLFRGQLCCDAAEYTHMAGSSKLAGVFASSGSGALAAPSKVAAIGHFLFANTGWRTFAYPAYLAAHRLLIHLLHLDPYVAWLDAAVWSAFLLYLLAAWVFYRAARGAGLPLHPFALSLLLAHPGLASYAALPITDTLAVAFLLLGISALARTFRASARRSAILWALLTGMLLGYDVLLRPSYKIALMLMLACWFLHALLPAGRRFRLSWTVPLAGIIAFFVLLSPRYISCTREAGKLCFDPPGPAHELSVFYVQLGLLGPRNTSVLWGKGSSVNVTTTDVFFLDHFAGHCVIGPSPIGSLLVCLARQAPLAPLFLLKKTAGLFDNFTLNTYATYVTPWWIVGLNRAWSMLAFGGFAVLCGAFFHMLARRKTSPVLGLCLLFTLCYAAYSSLVSIESRYSFPLVPFALFALLAFLDRVRRDPKASAWPAAAVGALMAFFLIQTLVWDRLDALPYVPLHTVTDNPAFVPAGFR
jgi:hypothetical protein